VNSVRLLACVHAAFPATAMTEYEAAPDHRVLLSHQIYSAETEGPHEQQGECTEQAGQSPFLRHCDARSKSHRGQMQIGGACRLATIHALASRGSIGAHRDRSEDGITHRLRTPTSCHGHCCDGIGARTARCAAIDVPAADRAALAWSRRPPVPPSNGKASNARCRRTNLRPLPPILMTWAEVN